MHAAGRQKESPRLCCMRLNQSTRIFCIILSFPHWFHQIIFKIGNVQTSLAAHPNSILHWQTVSQGVEKCDVALYKDNVDDFQQTVSHLGFISWRENIFYITLTGAKCFQEVVVTELYFMEKLVTDGEQFSIQDMSRESWQTPLKCFCRNVPTLWNVSVLYLQYHACGTRLVSGQMEVCSCRCSPSASTKSVWTNAYRNLL